MSDSEYESREQAQLSGPVVLDRAQIAKLERALGNLRPRDREIFLAVSRDGASHAEIAARHRCSAAKIRRIVARVLIELHRAVWPGE